MLNVGAVILCGGESRRMGRPKAWLQFGRTTLLEHVVHLVGTVAAPVVVAAASGQSLPDLPGDITVVHDRLEARGPLAGVAAAFAVLPQTVSFAYVTAVDSPLLKPGWIARLANLIGSHDLAIPHVNGQYFPLSALYRPSALRPAIERLLAEGRGPVSLVDCVSTLGVTAAELCDVDPTLLTLRNINTPDDYQEVLRAGGQFR